MLKNNLSRRAFVGSSLAGAATLVLAGCGGSNGSDANSGSDDSKPASGEKTKLTFCLDYTPNTNHTGIYVAKNQGFFEEEGLDVEIVQPADTDGKYPQRLLTPKRDEPSVRNVPVTV